MILSRHELISPRKREYEKDIVFTEDELKDNQSIINIEWLRAHVEFQYVAGLTLIKLHLEGDLVLRSTRTLKPVNYEFDEEDEFVLAHTEENYDPETMIRFTDNEFDLRPYIYSLLISSLPIQIIGEDDEEYLSGKNWEVMTEEEYLKRKQNDVSSSPFSALLDEEFED